MIPRPPDDEDRHPDGIGGESTLLEVHVPLPAAQGGPVVFEAYIDSDRIADERNAISRKTLPIALGGLLLFQLAILPLAWSLARRIDRARRDQADLVTRSLRAWHEERRRMAQDLHDGVVQDLSAVSYSLPTVTSALPNTPAGSAARSTVDRMIRLLQQDLHALRTMVLDLMPTDLVEIGLEAALVSLAERYTDDSLDISVEVEEGLDLDEDVMGVVYRVVREGLRNVQKHARAGHARVTVSQDADTVAIVLTDDGRGLAAARAATRASASGCSRPWSTTWTGPSTCSAARRAARRCGYTSRPGCRSSPAAGLLPHLYLRRTNQSDGIPGPVPRRKPEKGWPPSGDRPFPACVSCSVVWCRGGYRAAIASDRTAGPSPTPLMAETSNR